MSLRRVPLLSCVVALMSGCTFQSSCDTSGKLDSKKVEKAISKTVKENLGVAPHSVSCPSKIKAEKGGTFYCQVKVGKLEVRMVVEQTDEMGSVKYDLERKVIMSDKLEPHLVQRFKETAGIDVKVDCGQRIRDSKPGNKFSCTVTDAQGVKLSVGVNVNDDQANVSFDEPTPMPVQ